MKVESHLSAPGLAGEVFFLILGPNLGPYFFQFFVLLTLKLRGLLFVAIWQLYQILPNISTETYHCKYKQTELQLVSRIR